MQPHILPLSFLYFRIFSGFDMMNRTRREVERFHRKKERRHWKGFLR